MLSGAGTGWLRHPIRVAMREMQPLIRRCSDRPYREDSSCIGGGHDISGHGLSIFRGVSASSLSWQFRNNLGQSDGPRISGTFHVGNRHMSARRERCPFPTPAIQATPRPGPTAASFSLYLGRLALAGLAAPDKTSPPGTTGVTISVADARANEAAGATVDFEVSLSGASASAVTVDYATCRRHGDGGRGLHGDERHADLRLGRDLEDGERAGPR